MSNLSQRVDKFIDIFIDQNGYVQGHKPPLILADLLLMGADIRLAGVLPHCSVSGNARILPHDIPGLIRGVLIMVPAVFI